MSSLSFPVVSFAPFLTGSESEQRAVAQELYDAFHTYGWVYLKDFGISEEEVQEMFALSKKYFDRPLEKKLQEKLIDPAINQGYTADGEEKSRGRPIVTHKESYEYRRFKNDRRPSEDEMKGFQALMDEFYMKLYKLSKEVLRAVALILKLPSTFFDPLLEKADPQLRLLHYMPIPLTTLTSPDHARNAPHTDFGFCTILFQDSVGGLEVDPFHTGNFVPATPSPGTCVINIADLMQRLSNDRLKSTLHRVGPPQLSEDEMTRLGEGGMVPARYSTAFFVHPSPDVIVEPILGEGEKVKKYEAVNAGEWRNRIMAQNYSSPISV